MNKNGIISIPEPKLQALNPKTSTAEIMQCEDLERLAQIQIGLERRVGQLDVAMVEEKDGRGLAAGRAEKRLAIALIELSRQRTKAVRDTNSRLNHNFRQVAAEFLPANVYQEIEERARLPLKK